MINGLAKNDAFSGKPVKVFLVPEARMDMEL
jgi:hypothetical protein